MPVKLPIKMPLTKPLHFIVTRPINRATRLVERLSTLPSAQIPIKIDHCPLITIANYIDPKWQIANSVDFSNFEGVVFISGNAVDQAQKQLGEEKWTVLLQNPLFAIGEQTAKILQSDIDQQDSNYQKTKQPVLVKYPQQMDSEGLLAMPELANIQGQNWLIVKGLGGREKLKMGLQAGGAKVQELPVYQRRLPSLEQQRQIKVYHQSNPVWLVTSLQALNHLSRIINQKANNCRIIVSSGRIADEANNLNFEVVAQSRDATDVQLIECVKRLLGRLKS